MEHVAKMAKIGPKLLSEAQSQKVPNAKGKHSNKGGDRNNITNTGNQAFVCVCAI